ncbi:MAG: hypothetical protein MJ223_04350 [Mycoplasmoidaceae bacterium]|nr:hypothetical protein [Mycoplasmoidaceae bacterium]
MKQKTAILVEQKDAIKYLNSLHTVDYLISNPPYINKDNFKNKKMYK